MIYIRLAIAVFGFGSQLLRYLSKVEDRKLSSKDRLQKLKDFTGALENANKTGDTTDIESMFYARRDDGVSDK